jgi:hypothetical protein
MGSNPGQFQRRVSDEQLIEIARLRAEGLSYAAIAAEVKLCRSTIAYLVRRPDVQNLIEVERRNAARQARPRPVRRVPARAPHGGVARDSRRGTRGREREFTYEDVLNENDRRAAIRADYKRRGWGSNGMVQVRMPGGRGNCDPRDEDDIRRMTWVVADACPGLDVDEIRRKLVRANPGASGAIVFTEPGESKRHGRHLVDRAGDDTDT